MQEVARRARPHRPLFAPAEPRRTIEAASRIRVAMLSRGMTRSILDALDAAARTSRGIHFVGESRLSYADLRQAAARMGSALAERYAVGRPVLIVMPNGAPAVTAFFAALHAGLVPSVMPLPRPFADLTRTFEGLAKVSRHADHAPVLASPAVRDMLAKAPETAHLELLDPSTLDAAPTAPRSHGIGLIQFTSGSLGDPKGVVLTQDAVLGNGEAIARALDATPQDIGCAWVPLAHDMGLVGTLVFLMAETCDQVLMTTEQFARDPGQWLRVAAEQRATLVTGPPFSYELAARRLLRDAERGVAMPDLSSIRGCVVGAEPIDARTLRRVDALLAPYGFGAHGDPWVMAYGMAEYACVATMARGLRTVTVRPANAPGQAIEEDPAGLELTACGTALEGAEVRLVDGEGQAVGARVAGRIQLRGRSTMVGYWRDLERSTAAFDGPWIHTGDIGFMIDGALYISGREKDVIIVRGRHYFPEEVEAVALEVPGVRAGGVVAFGVVDPSGGPERVVVVIEAVGEASASGELDTAVRQHVADRLDLLVDVKITGAREVPRTPSGKPRRGEARQRWG